MMVNVYGVASVMRIDEIIVFFAKEPHKRDAILHKRPIILLILLTVATLCVNVNVKVNQIIHATPYFPRSFWKRIFDPVHTLVLFDLYNEFRTK